VLAQVVEKMRVRARLFGPSPQSTSSSDVRTNNHNVELEAALEELVLDLARDGCMSALLAARKDGEDAAVGGVVAELLSDLASTRASVPRCWACSQSKPTYDAAVMSSGCELTATAAIVDVIIGGVLGCLKLDG